jgi:hypothetical protein
MTLHRDFEGAPLSATYYPVALANALAGKDLNGSIPELWITLNASLDSDTVLGERRWYYGHDGGVFCGLGGCDIDLVSVFLHEIAHGLGFTTFFNYNSGEKFATRMRCLDLAPCAADDDCVVGQCALRGYDDRYLLQLVDGATGAPLAAMTPGERAAVIVSDGRLAWSGENLALASALLSTGADLNGDVHMHDPARIARGSSVSHFSPALYPDQFMEPGYTGPNHDTGLPGGLAADLLADLGWTLRRDFLCGDADGSGFLGVIDALAILRRALSLPGECSTRACDVNGDLAITVTDALMVLSRVVGNSVAFDCPVA